MRLAFVVLSLSSLACSGLLPKALPVGKPERDLVFEASEAGVVGVDPSAEEWTFEASFDGDFELTYSYDSPEGADQVLAIYTLAALYREASDARWSQTGANLGLGLVSEEGVDLIERDGLLTWGDDPSCRVFASQGIEVGAMCTARKGRRLYVVSVVGLPVTEPGALDALLAPQLAAFEAWSPSR